MYATAAETVGSERASRLSSPNLSRLVRNIPGQSGNPLAITFGMTTDCSNLFSSARWNLEIHSFIVQCHLWILRKCPFLARYGTVRDVVFQSFIFWFPQNEPERPQSVTRRNWSHGRRNKPFIDLLRLLSSYPQPNRPSSSHAIVNKKESVQRSVDNRVGHTNVCKLPLCYQKKAIHRRARPDACKWKLESFTNMHTPSLFTYRSLRHDYGWLFGQDSHVSSGVISKSQRVMQTALINLSPMEKKALYLRSADNEFFLIILSLTKFYKWILHSS